MDIVGIIKKSYRSYGSLFSDDFVAFIKESSQNNVSLEITFFSYRFFSIMKNLRYYFDSLPDMDYRSRHTVYNWRSCWFLPVEKEQTSQ
jgi:hypothetical protein